MIKKIIHKSDFLRNILTLLTGTTIAQAISIISISILYNIYSIEDFGTFGIYIAITNVLSIFCTLQYANSILLEKELPDALCTFRLSRILNISYSIFIGLLLIIIPNETITNLLNVPKLDIWIYMIPFSLLFIGQGQILRIWANRERKYKLISHSSILVALISPIISIAWGFYYEGWIYGLFIGLIIGQIVPSIYLYHSLRNENLKFIIPNLYDLKKIAVKHINFPKYTLPSEFISNFSRQLPMFVLSSVYGSSIAGLYDLGTKVLGIPSAFLSGSIQEVYKEKVTYLYNTKGSFKKIYFQTFKILSIMSLVGFGIIAITSPYLFELVFGTEKKMAGTIAQIMVIVYALRFINSPLSFAITLKGKQHIELIGSIWFTISSIIVFYLAFYFDLDYLNTLLYFSINFAFIYLIMIIYNFKISTE